MGVSFSPALVAVLLSLGVPSGYAARETELHETLALIQTGAPVDDGAQQVASDEISTLAKDVASSLPKIEPPSADRSTTTRSDLNREAKRIMAAFQELHEKLRTRNRFLIKKLSEAPTEEELMEFSKVRGLVLREETRTLSNMHNADACQISCSIDRECRSFSYNEAEQICLISKKSLKYSSDSTFYAKTGQNHHGAVKYAMYPGLYQDASAGLRALDQTKEECELSCSQVSQCRGYSFKEATGECARTFIKLDYDDKWNYFEKPARTHENGDPGDISLHREQDKLNKKFEQFWGEYEYNHRDMGKIVKLAQNADKIKKEAQGTEQKLRADKTTIARFDAKASDAKRRASSLVDALRNAQGAFTESKGDLSKAENDVVLAADKLNRHNEKIQKEREDAAAAPEAEDPEEIAKAMAKKQKNKEEGESLDQSLADMRAARDKAKEKSTMLQARVSDLAIEQKTNDEDQITSLGRRKKAKEEMSVRIEKMKRLAKDAKQVKKIVDAEVAKDSPPSFEPLDMSQYATPWNQKVTKAMDWTQKDTARRKEEEAAEFQAKWEAENP